MSFVPFNVPDGKQKVDASKAHSPLKHYDACLAARIEHVRGELPFFAREAHQKTPLNGDRTLVGRRALGYRAYMKPIHRRVGQLRPGVVKVPRLARRVEDILVVDRGLQFFSVAK